MSEFERQDMDCIDMVRKNRACHHGGEPMILMPKAEAVAMTLEARGKKRADPDEEPQISREKLMLQLAHGLAPICIGMAWVLAAFEGLADPAFTSIITGVCIFWGCVEWKWGKVNG